jgi:GNAT superfamily N-acetyltransferase
MTGMPRATGLFEAHLTVSDLDRSIEFYRDVVGLPLALVLEERGAAFLWIRGPGKAILGLWAYRGRGIGRSLIDAAIKESRSKGHSMLAVATAAGDVGNLRFYQLAGFRMRRVERDAFIPAHGYPAGLAVDGIPPRDRVWLDLDLNGQT